LAVAVLNIEGFSLTRLSNKQSSLSYSLPVPKPKEAAPAEQPFPELADDGPKRRSGGAADLLQGLSLMIDDEETTREAQGNRSRIRYYGLFKWWLHDEGARGGDLSDRTTRGII
jgi:hypothetical protein